MKVVGNESENYRVYGKTIRCWAATLGNLEEVGRLRNYRPGESANESVNKRIRIRRRDHEEKESERGSMLELAHIDHFVCYSIQKMSFEFV